jgi:hypothetical protein
MTIETNRRSRPLNRIDPVEGVHRAIRIIPEIGLDLKEDTAGSIDVVLNTKESMPSKVNAATI